MINFPTSIDSFPNPTSTDLMENATTALDHDQQHSNANDAIEALEAKVGINSSAVTTSHDYKLSGVSTGDKAVSKTGTETLTNKTLTAPQINFGSDANGDMIIRNSSGVSSRLAVGSSGQILNVDAGTGLPAWVSNPSASDASTTVKGVVEIATTAQITAGTGTGETGALLVVPASAVGSVGASKIVQFNSSTQYPAADGSLITNVNAPLIYLTASNNLKYSADTERTITSDATYTIKKQITIRQKGIIRVKFDLKGSDTTYSFKGRIYVNGIAVGTERNQQGAGATTYTTYSEDITINAYDIVQLYIKNEATGGLTTYCRNFQIYYDISNPENGTVDTN